MIDLNIIHLDHRKDRRASFLKQIIENGISASVWPGIKSDLPFTGISKAHKQIVLHAKNSNLPFVRIAEDDFLFTSPDSWKTYIDNTPEFFDLYLGGVSGGAVNEENKTVTGFSGLFFYAIHERFFDCFLQADENKNIDRWLGNNYGPYEEVSKLLSREPVYKVCFPIEVITMDGYSDQRREYVEHEKYFRPYLKN